MINNTYISSEGDRGILKEKRAVKTKRYINSLFLLSMADTYIWSLSYMKQTFIFRECDVIVKLPDWSAPWPLNQQAELSRTVLAANYIWVGGEEKKMLV